MITDYSSILNLFTEIDGQITGDAEIFMIGGGALMSRGLKTQTKDIDIVVDSENEFHSVQNAFMSAGFVKNIPGKEYERLALSQILTRDDFRVDLFCKEVCGKFALSEGMKKRSREEHIPAEKIRLKVCSMEDIMLFKTMTERDGDETDCGNIIRAGGLDWNTVLEEAVVQSERGEAVWITWIAARLNYFAERGMPVPILNAINKLADDYIEEWEKGLLSRNPEKL